MVVFYNCEMALSTIATLGPLAWNAFKYINKQTNGKFGGYVGGKLLEGGAHTAKYLLEKINSEKANKAAKWISEKAKEAAAEITGEDSDITKKIGKAAGIISPELATPTVTIEQSLNMIDSVPYSKRLYGSNFQRYEPRHVRKVKIVKKKRRGRILQDINGQA